MYCSRFTSSWDTTKMRKGEKSLTCKNNEHQRDHSGWNLMTASEKCDDILGSGKTDRELSPGLMCNFIAIDFLLWKFFLGSWELELVLGDLAAMLLFFFFYESGRAFPKLFIHILSSLLESEPNWSCVGSLRVPNRSFQKDRMKRGGLRRKKENIQRKKRKTRGGNE